MLDTNFLIFFLASVEIIKACFPHLKLLELPRLFFLKVACIIKQRQLFNENFRRLKLTKKLFADKYYNPQKLKVM